MGTGDRRKDGKRVAAARRASCLSSGGIRGKLSHRRNFHPFSWGFSFLLFYLTSGMYRKVTLEATRIRSVLRRWSCILSAPMKTRCVADMGEIGDGGKVCISGDSWMYLPDDSAQGTGVSMSRT